MALLEWFFRNFCTAVGTLRILSSKLPAILAASKPLKNAINQNSSISFKRSGSRFSTFFLPLIHTHVLRKMEVNGGFSSLSEYRLVLCTIIASLYQLFTDNDFVYSRATLRCALMNLLYMHTKGGNWIIFNHPGFLSTPPRRSLFFPGKWHNKKSNAQVNKNPDYYNSIKCTEIYIQSWARLTWTNVSQNQQISSTICSLSSDNASLFHPQVVQTEINCGLFDIAAVL